MMVIDLRERQPVGIMPSGLVSYISWTRLVEQLRAAGEIKDNETVTHFSVDLTGINYRVERK